MKLLFTIAGVVSACVLNAQVNTYPYSQDFEDPFLSGRNVTFLPDWWGNYMVPDTMGQFSTYAHSGSSSLFMRPEGEEFRTIVQVRLDLSTAANTYADFWIASRKNGSAEDEKRVRFNAAVSVDGGVTFPFVTTFGPHEGFENANTAFANFRFVFPPVTDNKPNVVLRFIGRSGGGPHLPAILLIDDVTVTQAPADIFPPYMMGSEVAVRATGSLRIAFSEPLHPDSALVAAHYQFRWPEDEAGTPLVGDGPLPAVTQVDLSSDGYAVTLTLDPPLSVGETYSLAILNSTDLNGNTAGLIAVDGLVFNEPPPGSLLISEVLFADPSSVPPKQKLQYVELFNPTDKVVPLGGLRIKGAISAHDLPNVKLQPGGYWVATRNAASFLATFGQTAWEWKGSWIEYEDKEGEIPEPQSLFIQTTNRHGGELVDSIGFDFSKPAWDALNKPGFSMELCDPRSGGINSSNWSLTNDTEPYYYTADGSAYKIYATPGTSCENPDQLKYYCTYGQGFYGETNQNGCDPRIATSAEMMQAVLPASAFQVFGLESTNRYFILKGSDVANGAVFNMLPGGKSPAPLRQAGGATYGSTASWSRVPLSKSKNSWGKIENGLLSQAITLFFNLGWNSRKLNADKFTLATVKLYPLMTSSKSATCGPPPDSTMEMVSVNIPQRVLDHLNQNYEHGASVGNLFDLANRMLGADPSLVQLDLSRKPTYLSVTASEVASALEAMNTLFDGCRVNQSTPERSIPDPLVYATSAREQIEAESGQADNGIVAYPNPFYDKVTIAFASPNETRAKLEVCTPAGTTCETLFEGIAQPGETNRVVFAPKSHSSGFYIIKLSTQGKVSVSRIILLK